MKLRDQKNYIITVIVSAVIVAIGMAVYYNHKNNKANPPSLPEPTSRVKGQFEETDGYFTVNVPHDWTAETLVVNGGSKIALIPAENTDVVLGPNPQDANSGNYISITVYKANPDLTAWENQETKQATARGITITNTTINGQPAFLETGGSNGNKNLTYYIWNGAYIVSVTMPVTEPSSKVDNSQYVSQFDSIAQSLKMLK